VTSERRVVIGVDTHLDTIHVAAITDTGQLLGDAEFGTNPTGYYVALTWARSFGKVLIAGVEGTSSYGAGFTQALQDNAIHVVEVNRPDRSARRRQGKSDPLDAYSAARAVLAGNGLAVPKDPNTTALRALLTARRGAVKARTAAIQQIKDLLVTAPAELRERYRRYTTTLRLVQALSKCRPFAHQDPTTVSVLIACRALAQRIEFLERQDRDLTAEIDTLTTAINPAPRAAHGVGPDTAAQLIITAGTNAHRLRGEAAFARLSGAAPIPASSGKTTRHRLSRGGDRAADNALHRIALVRWSNDPRTRDYVARQLAAGRCKKDILRQLKRAIAREMFRLLTRDRRLPRPAASPASQKHHPDRGSRAARSLAHDHLPPRTRPALQRHFGQRLPPMAQCRRVTSWASTQIARRGNPSPFLVPCRLRRRRGEESRWSPRSVARTTDLDARRATTTIGNQEWPRRETRLTHNTNRSIVMPAAIEPLISRRGGLVSAPNTSDRPRVRAIRVFGRTADRRRLASRAARRRRVHGSGPETRPCQGLRFGYGE
jgi:hypothetical protein